VERFYRPSPIRYLFRPTAGLLCWGRPIFSATDGIVVQAEDGWPEQNPVHIARDFAIMLKNARTFNANRTADLRQLSGNYIIIEASDGYVVYAHAQTGSIKVRPGDKVVSGQELAKVGHSGNSTAPHLHFQLMDHYDSRKAQGILCCFRDYEVFQEGAWRLVHNGIPKSKDRIRKL
jgi:murein DD-endopeptidase MepM/ murein hydrolase activator NlpD